MLQPTHKIMVFFACYKLSTIQQRSVLTPTCERHSALNRGPRLFISGNCWESRLKMSGGTRSRLTAKEPEEGARLACRDKTCCIIASEITFRSRNGRLFLLGDQSGLLQNVPEHTFMLLFTNFSENNIATIYSPQLNFILINKVIQNLQKYLKCCRSQIPGVQFCISWSG